MADKYQTSVELLPGTLNHWTGRNNHPVEGMFVHVAEGYRTGVTGWFNNPEAEASSNYLVCKDGTRVQFVKDEDTAWANGIIDHPNMGDPFIAKWTNNNINPNRRTISIETERYKGERLTFPQQDSLNELAVKLHKKYTWPADGSRIWAHNEVDSVNRPNCPSLSPQEWSSLVGAVAKLGVVIPPVVPEVNPNSVTYDVLTGKYVHPDIWKTYNLKQHGHPLGEAYMYSDGWIRQLFEYCVLGYKDNVIRVEGLGQAWAAKVGPIVEWPGVTALR